MTNPVQAMRMLITYAVIIPIAILAGYFLTNPLDYGTLGFLAFILAVLASPIIIKFNYQILVFGLGCPAVLFFLPGRPPMSEAVAAVCLGIAILERILSSERRFISPAVIVWPLIFIAFMAYMTAELAHGGIAFNAIGGGAGGGRKYITLFVGIAAFFALTSRAIPPERRNFYIALSFLTPLTGMIGDLFTVLPGPLKYINLLFPPTVGSAETLEFGVTRFRSFSFAVGTVLFFMLVRYGLRGVFNLQHPWRVCFFTVTFCLTMLGGFRSSLASMMVTLTLLFFLEGMHRTRLMPVVILGGALGVTILASFSDRLPYTFQRSMSFLPLKWNAEVVTDVEGSSEWRYRIWRATWPKVPEHLLLGKGYSLSKEDYDMIGQGIFARSKLSRIDEGDDPLAISGDYHSGPLTTLMAFGVWGAIGILWLMGAVLFVTYRNYRYGDPSLHNFNIFIFVLCINSIISFLFIFGGFNNDVANFAKMAGFSIAINAGIARKPVAARSNPRIKPLVERPAG